MKCKGIWKKASAIILALVLLFAAFPTVLSASAYSAGDSVRGKTVCQALGMDGAAYMNWLLSHERDDYYLGTPYLPYDHRNPNGDCSGAYGWLDEEGEPGMNCMGFVWHVLYKATLASDGDLDAVDAEADGRLSFYQDYNITRRYFRSKKEMLRSGYLEKGDIIWMIPDQDEYLETVYHHTGIYWGDGHSDLMWHSNTETGGQGEANVISKIYPMLDRNTMYVVLKVGAKTLQTPRLTDVYNVERGLKLRWNAVSGAARYRVFVKKAGRWKVVGDTKGTSFVYTDAVDGEKYTFTVRCVTACGKGFTSFYNKYGITGLRCSAPKVTFSNTPTGIKLQWNAVKGAACYKVYVKDGEGYTGLAKTTDTQYFFPKAENGRSYVFTVRSVPKEGSGGAYCLDGYGATFYAPPKVTDIRPVSDGIRMCWSSPSDEIRRFRIFRREGDAWIRLADTAYTAFTDKTADKSGCYIYAIRALSADGRRFLTGYRPEILRIVHT